MSRTISSVFGGNLGGISGCLVTAYAESRITPAPVKGTDPPGSPTYGPVSTGTAFGSAGAWRLVVGTDNYWISVLFNTVHYWTLYPAEGGGSALPVVTIEVGGTTLEFRSVTAPEATGSAGGVYIGYVDSSQHTLVYTGTIVPGSPSFFDTGVLYTFGNTPATLTKKFYSDGGSGTPLPLAPPTLTSPRNVINLTTLTTGTFWHNTTGYPVTVSLTAVWFATASGTFDTNLRIGAGTHISNARNNTHTSGLSKAFASLVHTISAGERGSGSVSIIVPAGWYCYLRRGNVHSPGATYGFIGG